MSRTYVIRAVHPSPSEFTVWHGRRTRAPKLAPSFLTCGFFRHMPGACPRACAHLRHARAPVADRGFRNADAV
eukprot:6792038-Prymnesium_polylepis.1